MSKITLGIISVPVDKLPYKYNECEPLPVNMKLRLTDLFSQFIGQGEVTVMTDAEYGVPLWCAEIACALKLVGNKIRLCIAVAHDEQDITWYEDWRDRYYKAIEKADDVVTPDIEYTENCHEMQQYRVACERYIIDNSNAVIAVKVNSEQPEAVKYANEIKVPVILFNAESLDIHMG